MRCSPFPVPFGRAVGLLPVGTHLHLLCWQLLGLRTFVTKTCIFSPNLSSVCQYSGLCGISLAVTASDPLACTGGAYRKPMAQNSACIVPFLDEPSALGQVL